MNKIADKELHLFFKPYTTLNFKKREVILRPLDNPRGVYFLKKGYIRCNSISKSGEELTLIIYKPGDVFPYSWIFNNENNIYHFETMTPAIVKRAPKEAFLKFISENPAAIFDTVVKTSIRITGLFERMESLTFGNAYGRVASIILISCYRFGKGLGKSVVIQLPLTHKDIAILSGVARETASIEINHLKRKGIISYKGKLLKIKNLKKLQDEVQS